MLASFDDVDFREQALALEDGLRERVNHGYTEAELATLRADLARVRAAQAEKAAR